MFREQTVNRIKFKCKHKRKKMNQKIEKKELLVVIRKLD